MNHCFVRPRQNHQIVLQETQDLEKKLAVVVVVEQVLQRKKEVEGVVGE